MMIYKPLKTEIDSMYWMKKGLFHIHASMKIGITNGKALKEENSWDIIKLMISATNNFTWWYLRPKMKLLVVGKLMEKLRIQKLI